VPCSCAAALMFPACGCHPHCAGELRFQSLVVPKLGWPPALLGKGPHIPFASGSPLVTVGPPLPGYTRQLGSGLFGQRGYTCPESLK